jgi:phosphopantothenoylcysteine decarboxylase/phosphopantothenate--cysteine ligase
MGGDRNTVHILTLDKSEVAADIAVDSWPVMTKEEVADALVAKIADTIGRVSK